MKRYIKVVPFEEHEAVNFYSLIIDNNKDCEMIRLTSSLMKSGYASDIGIIAGILSRIGGNKTGAEERYFRPAGRRADNVWELPPHYLVNTKLRLYCLRYGNSILVLGNGGIKNTRTYQEDPHLNSCVEILQQTDAQISEYLRTGEIQIIGKQIIGKLNFYI